MKQTVVEFLISLLNVSGYDTVLSKDEINKAKELEKQQIIDAWIAGYNSRGNEDMIGGTGNEENEYYTETFNK